MKLRDYLVMRFGNNEISSFEKWAFGDTFDDLSFSEIRDRWNQRNKDLFEIHNNEHLFYDFVDRMIQEWVIKNRKPRPFFLSPKIWPDDYDFRSEGKIHPDKLKPERWLIIESKSGNPSLIMGWVSALPEWLEYYFKIYRIHDPVITPKIEWDEKNKQKEFKKKLEKNSQHNPSMGMYKFLTNKIENSD